MKHAAIPFAFEFRRRVLFPVVGLIIVAFAFAVGLLYQVSQAQDSRARDQSLRFAREAIETRTQNLRRTLKDYAAWGAAYEASGADPAVVATAVANTTAFYAPDPETPA